MTALRPVHYKTLVRIFERDGFNFDRQRGDHLIFTKPGSIRPLVIPAYHEVPVFIVKNLLRTAGMSRERYLELLQNSSMTE
jgi:predicted RNA binding protein YcfA (HicA-like mRNA interferase family)